MTKTNSLKYLAYKCKVPYCLGDECPEESKHIKTDLVGGHKLELTATELSRLLFSLRCCIRNEHLLGMFADDVVTLYLKIKNT